MQQRRRIHGSRKKHIKAFSLIELSIVVLIIGILIAGVTQSTKLVRKARLTEARSQTESSIVNSIDNLITWFETTSEDSFDESDSEDGVEVSTWYDINPQSPTKNNAEQSSETSSLHPTYSIDCINNLPCLQFNGTAAYMTTSKDYGTSDELTIFVVFKVDALPETGEEYHFVSYHGSWSSSSYSFAFKHRSNMIAFQEADYGEADSDKISTVESNIATGIDDGSSRFVYLNGVAGSEKGSSNTKNLESLDIGAWNNGSEVARYLDGSLGEIIIFDRALSDTERSSVEDYLSKKWKISLN